MVLKANSNGRPSGLCTKLPIGLSMKSKFFDWVQALEHALNQCSSIPSESEVQLLLENSINIDLQSAVLDSCIKHGDYNPSLIFWFDELVSHVYTRYRRIRDILRIDNAVNKGVKWAANFTTVIFQIGRDPMSSSPGTDLSMEMKATLHFEYFMTKRINLLGMVLDELEEQHYFGPSSNSLVLVPIPSVTPNFFDISSPHLINSHDQKCTSRCITSSYSEDLVSCPICAKTSIDRLFINTFFGPRKKFSIFWNKPEVSRPGYLMCLHVFYGDIQSLAILQDGYSYLTAIFTISKTGYPDIWAKILYAARTVMGTLPQVLIIPKTLDNKDVLFPIEAFKKAARKSQIDLRYIGPSYRSAIELDFFREQILDPSPSMTEPFGKSHVRYWQEVQDDLNYHPSLVGNVSPYERHFNVPPPRFYKRDKPYGNQVVRSYLYGIPKHDTIKGGDKISRLSWLCGMHSLNWKNSWEFWSKENSARIGDEYFKELRNSVANHGFLRQDFQVGDLVLFSYIDEKFMLELIKSNPDVLVELSVFERPLSMVCPVDYNFVPSWKSNRRKTPPAIPSLASKAARQVVTKGTNHARPPFLSPFKVLEIKVDKNEPEKKLFCLQLTGPRKVLIKDVPHACLRRCYTGIQIKFGFETWNDGYI